MKIFTFFKQEKLKYNIDIFRPFTQYLGEAPLASITDSSLLGYDSSSFADLDLSIFFCSASPDHSPVSVAEKPLPA